MSALLILALPVLVGLAALVYTGAWHTVTLFVWQHPMLSWMPILTVVVVGLMFKLSRAAVGGEPARGGWLELGGESGRAQPDRRGGGRGRGGRGGDRDVPARAAPGSRTEGGDRPRGRVHGLPRRPLLHRDLPPAVGLDDIDYERVEALPERTRPRLLPRTGVRDDPSFAEAKEIHLTRHPETGDLMWTGEWQASALGGPSSGVSVKRLDDLLSESEIVRAGFADSVSGIGPGTLKWKAKLRHPFSRIQYPVLIPTGGREAIAVAPYVGYKGFPLRTPYLKGVLVYHRDGTLEDLTPEEAAERPELAASGRIVPETVARKQAEALAHSDELEGKIVDGKDNKQPFLTAIDRQRTVWMTIINKKGRNGGVKAIVLADSSTGETEVLEPVAEHPVDADVREPDQADLGEDRRIGEHTGRREDDRPKLGVNGVVARRADAPPGEIAEDREVRGQEEKDEGEDAVVGV